MALEMKTEGLIDIYVGQWCLNKVPPHLKREIDYDYEIDGQAVSIFEVRPKWKGQPGETTRKPIARFRYVKVSKSWKLYWMRQTGKWESYQPDLYASNLELCLDIIDADKYGCFFG
jgi:hypothetical protein